MEEQKGSRTRSDGAFAPPLQHLDIQADTALKDAPEHVQTTAKEVIRSLHIEATPIPEDREPWKPGMAKMTDEVADLAIRLLAQFCTQRQVQARILEEYDLEVTISTISRFAKRRAEHIEARQEEYLATYKDTPLAWRKVRVVQLSGIYDQAMGGLDAANVKAKGKSFFYALEALKAIREEMEPIEGQLGAGSTKDVDEMIAKLQDRINSDRAGKKS